MEDRNLTVNIDSGTIFKTIVFLVLFSVLYFLRDIVLLVLSAIVIAAAIKPGVKWFEDRKVPTALGVIVIYVVLGLLGGVIILFIVPTLISDFSSALENFTKLAGGADVTARAFTGTLLEGYIPLLKNITFQDVAAGLQAKVSAVSGNPLQAASAIFGGFLSFILVLVLSFYFSVIKGGVSHLLHLITPARHEEYVIGLWKRTQSKIGAWMQGQLLLCILVGVLTYIALAIFGIKHALLLGFLAGVLEIIPLFGSTLAAVPAIMIGFAQGGLPLGLIAAACFLIIQQFEAHLFYPLVVRKIVGISPLLVILALVVGGKLAGVIGILLAIPMSVLLVEYVQDFDRNRRKMNQQI